MSGEVPASPGEFGKPRRSSDVGVPAEASGKTDPRKPGLDQVIGYIREKNPPEGVEIFKDAKEGTDEEKINRIVDGLLYTLVEVAEEAYEKRNLDPNYERIVRGIAPLCDFVRFTAEGKLALERKRSFEIRGKEAGGGEVFAYRTSFISNGRRYQGEVLNRVGLGDIQGGPDQRLQFRIFPTTFGEQGTVGVRIDWERDFKKPSEPPKVTYDLEVYLPGRENDNLVDHLDLTGSGQWDRHHWLTVEVLPEGRKQFRRILERINQAFVTQSKLSL